MTQLPMLTILNKIIDALNMRHEFETSNHFHVRIPNEPYMDLIIEAWNAPESYNGEKRHISIAHYFVQNGDSIADPEVVIGEHGYPHQFTQWTTKGSRCYPIYWKEDDKTMVDLYQRQDTLSFLRIWTRNLREQGFIEAAKEYATGGTR